MGRHYQVLSSPKHSQKFALRLRIPGWAENSPVPSNLYSFADKPRGYTVKVNGQTVDADVIDGYAVINRKWTKGDRVELSLPMDVRRVRANDNVQDDRGKLALERGPIVYCLEGADQKDSTVFNKFILQKTAVSAAYDGNLLGGVVVLSGAAKQVETDGDVSDITFRAIPYAAWCNRGSGQMGCGYRNLLSIPIPHLRQPSPVVPGCSLIRVQYRKTRLRRRRWNRKLTV